MDLIETPEEGTFLRHPWEVARRQFFADLLAPMVSGGAVTMLDAGAGDGWFARGLAGEHPTLQVTCFDPGYPSEPRAPDAGGRVTYVATQPPGPFGVVTLLDVLEHVEDDASLLNALVGTLEPSGYLLASVPTWPSLFSSHDVTLKHFRRYVPRELIALLHGAGLTVVQSGGLFHSLLAPRALSVAMERVRGDQASRNGSDGHVLEWRGGPRSRRLAVALLGADTRLSRLAAARHLQIPGLSCWALCQKR